LLLKTQTQQAQMLQKKTGEWTEGVPAANRDVKQLGQAVHVVSKY